PMQLPVFAGGGLCRSKITSVAARAGRTTSANTTTIIEKGAKVPAIVPLLLALAIVITTAKLGGWLLTRFGQPPILGELLVGLVLGPSVLNLFAQPYFASTHTLETLQQLGELGVVLLMFAAGLEIPLADLTRTGKPAALTGIFGVVAPLLFSLVIVPLFG